ncbi:MAG TPA: NAD-dependent epimerase/dehydratase family protein [Acidimicrobiales bacterium]|nr:NAD-dependent epimerase/dehydratase family protein [Acidimicrobiales bacterium]
MRALVLGGNRYIGRELVFELARQGHEVTVLNSHVAPLPDGARRLHGDRRVAGVLAEVLTPRRDDFDIVFDNTAYAVTDLNPLVELFHDRVQQFVFTSSVAVYKRSFIQPVDECFARHNPNDADPRKAYGVGKVQCEDYLADLHRDHGFPATTMRVSHTIGPRSPLVTREPIFFARLEQGRPILIPGDGFPFVHLIHITDAARAIASVAGNQTAIGQAYNVAGTEITSVLGCVRLMARAVGVEPDVVHVPMDVARQLSRPLLHWGEALLGGTIYSTEKLRAELHWSPQFGLEDGYRDAYAWFASEGRGLYDYDFSPDDDVLAKIMEVR